MFQSGQPHLSDIHASERVTRHHDDGVVAGERRAGEAAHIKDQRVAGRKGGVQRVWIGMELNCQAETPREIAPQRLPFGLRAHDQRQVAGLRRGGSHKKAPGPPCLRGGGMARLRSG